jgi:hypothetical protein
MAHLVQYSAACGQCRSCTGAMTTRAVFAWQRAVEIIDQHGIRRNRASGTCVGKMVPGQIVIA